jgi:hypothetical protein
MIRWMMMMTVCMGSKNLKRPRRQAGPLASE